MNNNIKTFVNHLEQEINWVDQLNTLLAEEKIVLATRQFAQLEHLADQKQDLSGKLEESAKQRIELLNNAAATKTPKLALNELLKQCNPEDTILINNLNTKLADHLTRCRELNTVNGQVIANNIHTRQEIVNALSGNTTDAVNLYTANGNVTSTTDKSHHQEA